MKRARLICGVIAIGAAVAGTAVVSTVSSATVVPPGPVWAVGYTENFVTERVLGPLVERLSGGSWHSVSSPRVAGGWLQAVAGVGPANAWTVGLRGRANVATQGLIEHWNGSSWKQVPSPDVSGGSYLSAVSASSASDVWAVGGTGRGPGPSASTLVDRWDGSSWQRVPNPSPGYMAGGEDTLNGVAAVSPTDVWAVGDSYAAQASRETPLIEHWNGSSWASVPTPNVGDGELDAISAVTAKDVWAVGCLGSYSCANSKTLVEHWNGSAWKRVPSPSPGDDAYLVSVTGLSGTDAWAVGGIFDVNGTHLTLIEHWNGSAWKRVTSPTPSLGFGSVELDGVIARSATNVWAVGAYDTGQAWLAFAEHWNGTAWQQVTAANPSRANLIAGIG